MSLGTSGRKPWLQQSRLIEPVSSRGAVQGCRGLLSCSESLRGWQVDRGVSIITGRGHRVSKLGVREEETQAKVEGSATPPS